MVNTAIIITLARGNGLQLRILCFHRRAVKCLYCNKIAGENDSKALFFHVACDCAAVRGPDGCVSVQGNGVKKWWEKKWPGL